MREQKNLFRGEAGQTLLEILLAFSVSILVLSAVIFGITTSLSNTQYTKNQNLANSYAREGMAIVRKTRDSGWSQFVSSYTTNTTYCLNQGSTELISASGPPTVVCGINVGIFTREIIFEHDSLSCCSNSSPICEMGIKGSKAAVKVSWSDNKCPVGTPFCHKVELITCFSNIDQKQAP